jgi:D-beta-D-heptose 7-phosphate kinase/D-beta-D-heptose 1-phosphate adenosyltransferase
MVALEGLSDWAPGPVLLLGDLMLDRYTWGYVERISPEAPVPVLHVEREEERAGGAGNVALNLSNLGVPVRFAGRVGNDGEGERIKALLQAGGVDTSALLVDASPTPVKQRLIAQGQQLVRVDREQSTPLSSECFERLKRHLSEQLKGIALVILSDYAKGALTPDLVRWIVAESRREGVRVVIDPKGIHWDHYRGAALVKPNWSEARRVASLQGNDVQAIGERLMAQLECEALAITRAQDGVSLFLKEKQRIDFPAQVREVKDVTGAGDTVLAVMGGALASGYTYEKATHLANLAGGIAVEHVGCHRITLDELALAMGRNDWRSKLVNPNHLALLSRMLRHRSISLVVIREEAGLHPWSQLHALPYSPSHRTIVLIPPGASCNLLTELCASLPHVHFVIRTSDLELVREHLTPQWIFELDGTRSLTT